MLVKVSLAKVGNKFDRKLISEECMKSIFDSVVDSLSKANVRSDPGMKVYLCGRGFKPMFRLEDEVGGVVGVSKRLDGTIVAHLSLFGVGANFHNRKEREAEYIPTGSVVRASDKRIWYMPWKKRQYVDQIKVDGILMMVNTD